MSQLGWFIDINTSKKEYEIHVWGEKSQIRKPYIKNKFNIHIDNYVLLCAVYTYTQKQTFHNKQRCALTHTLFISTSVYIVLFPPASPWLQGWCGKTRPGTQSSWREIMELNHLCSDLWAKPHIQVPLLSPLSSSLCLLTFTSSVRVRVGAVHSPFTLTPFLSILNPEVSLGQDIYINGLPVSLSNQRLTSSNPVCH